MNRTLETLDGWIDLAAASIGGRALVANDEFFAAKENLLEAGRAVFDPDRYTDRGKWMDGWESRRRRTPGHDWCIVRLGLPGEIRAAVVDTGHFGGNHPQAAWIDRLELDEPISAADLDTHAGWRPLAPRTELVGDAENRLTVTGSGRTTHVRLAIDPDGGVARLRLFGTVCCAWPRVLASGEAVDLATLAHGGRVVASSDAFFSSPIHLLMPGDGVSMADGWETRRRRGPGHDWVIIRLGRPARLERAVVDTRHFKGNFPAACALAACDAAGEGDPSHDADAWRPLLRRSPLSADAEHAFGLADGPPVTHVRFDIFPDGGVSRLRLFGRPVEEEPAG